MLDSTFDEDRKTLGDGFARNREVANFTMETTKELRRISKSFSVSEDKNMSDSKGVMNLRTKVSGEPETSVHSITCDKSLYTRESSHQSVNSLFAAQETNFSARGLQNGVDWGR